MTPTRAGAPTALIAEDEPLLAAGLRADLARAWPELEVVAVVGDGGSAVREALERQPQVCFLDIRMPVASGLEAAQALVEDWPAQVPFPLLVFVTAYDQYALQAFDVQAADYLVKPVTPERLDACVSRLKRRLDERAAPGPALSATVEQLRSLLDAMAPPAAAQRLEVVQAQSGATVHVVPVDEVLYFEAADKYVRVVTADDRRGELLIRTSLRDLMPQLDPARFWQVHRGTVVSVRAIATARREDTGKVTLTLRDRPERLVASRLYAHRFKGM